MEQQPASEIIPNLLLSDGAVRRFKRETFSEKKDARVKFSDDGDVAQIENFPPNVLKELHQTTMQHLFNVASGRPGVHIILLVVCIMLNTVQTEAESSETRDNVGQQLRNKQDGPASM